jgi:tetratricopeptide (TPR) repeat protein
MAEPKGTLLAQNGTKTKVFISYSRRNLDFAEGLQSALKDLDYEILLDRTDIAHGEDWQVRLGSLILSADTIVFAISPASSESQICAWEVEEAVRLGKRILPVVAVKTPDHALPPLLARLNFIFFDGKDFSESLKELDVALKQDLPWLREQTRLGDLAQQWQNQKAGVLRGKALEEAEQWLASPHPEAGVATDLHRSFIAASRKAATQRQRYWIAGILGVALISIGLTIWSEVNRKEAVAQRTIAEAQTKLAIERKAEADTQRGLADDKRVEAEKQKARAEAAVETAASAANDMLREIAIRFKNTNGISVSLVKDVLERARSLQKKLSDSGETSVSVRKGEAEALITLVDTYQVAGELKAAANASRDAILILTTLRKQYPGDYVILQDLGVSYEKIGNVFVAEGDLATALESFQNSLTINQVLFDVDKEDKQAQHDISVGYNKIGDVLFKQGNLASALLNYQNSLRIRETLMALVGSTTDAQRDVSISHENIGNVFYSQGKFEDALANYQKSLSIMDPIAAQNKDNNQLQRDLAIRFEKLGNVLTAKGDFSSALENYRKGLAIIETLAMLDKDNAEFQQDLSNSLEKIGNMLVSQGDLTNALVSYSKCLSVRQMLGAKDDRNKNVQRGIMVSYNKIGNVLLSQQDLVGAIKNYESGQKIAEMLVALDPSNAEAKRDLSISYGKIGNVLLNQGNLAGAIDLYKKDLAIAEELAAKDSSNAQSQRDLFVTYRKLAEAGEAPRENYSKALAILVKLRAIGKLKPTDVPFISELEKSLSELK